MSNQIARRQFMQIAPAIAALGAGLGVRASATTQGNTPGAGESKIPRLSPGCCAYSYNSLFKSGQLTLEDFIRKAVDLRIDAVDMTVYYLRSTDPAYLANLRHLAYKHSVNFSGAACGSSMVQADADKRAQTLTDIRKWIDVTDQLGASHLRIFAGKLPEGVPLQQAVDWTVDAMRAASDYSAKKGIMLGVEDHAGVTQSAAVCLEIMQRVNSPYAGINLDITHFIPTADADPYAQIASCIPYATHTHIRDRFDDGSPVNMDRVWRMFVDAGYQGYMSAEYEDKFTGGESPLTGVPKLLAKIRTFCQKYSSI